MKLNFEEFTGSMCSFCLHCSLTYLIRKRSSFCYTMYEKNPVLFARECYPKLRKLDRWPLIPRRENEAFYDIFCKSGICANTKGKNCLYTLRCMGKQTDCILGVESAYYPKIPKKVINTPSMIYGGSKEWVKLIKDNW